MLQRIHILVSGRVQGVGFRYFTKQKANAIGLVGWTRNLPDGRVEIEAQGKPEHLHQFRLYLEEGPSLSRVDKVNFNEIPTKEAQRFEIRY